MAKKIKHVTQERLRELFTLTNKGLTTKIARCNAPVGSNSYLHKSTGYKIFKVDSRQYREHRLVWLFVHGTLPKTIISYLLILLIFISFLKCEITKCICNAIKKHHKSIPKKNIIIDATLKLIIKINLS